MATVTKHHHPSVLHVASGDLWAGAEVQLFNLARAQHQNLHIPVNVVLLNHGVLEQQLLGIGISVTVLDESRLNVVQILQGIMNSIRNYRPDIVHTHRTKENVLGSIAALFAGRTPSLRTVHGAPEHYKSWQDIAGKIIEFLDWLCGRILQARIISVSVDLASILQKSYPQNRISVIENGIDIHRLDNMNASPEVRSTHACNDVFNVGFAGRLVPVKRVDLLIETAAYVRTHHTGLNVRFHIFGDGPLLEELKKLSQKLETTSMVNFHGHQNDIYRSLSDLDAVLLTSDHEGLPMILLEAMSLGVPIIAHSVGGIPRLLGEGSYGLLVHDQKPESYAHSILTLISSEDKVGEMTHKARTRVISHYSAEKNARSYLQVYKAVAKRSRSMISD